MTDTEILQWLHRVATAAAYALQDGEPIYLERIRAEISHEIGVIEAIEREGKTP